MVLIWLACLPRMVPSLVLDRGIFVSVGERLLAGDVLYRDVWDNKDPLFYYGVALGRLVSPLGDIVLEAAWVLLAALAMIWLARSVGCSPSWALLAGFGMTPLVVTGGLYLAGYSHLPGVAVTMLALAAAVRRRYGAAGALIGVLLFLKLVMIPVAVLPVALMVLLRRDLRRVPVAALGFAVACAVVLLVLLLRGELQPYLQSLRLNVAYSSASLVDMTYGPVVGHLLRILTPDSVIVTIVVLVIAVWLARGALVRRVVDRMPSLIWACTLAALVAAIAVLAVTGLWPQHDQILMVPALLAGLAVVARVHRTFDIDAVSRRAIASIVVFACFAVVLSGPAPIGYLKSALGAPALTAALLRVPPEAAALRSLSTSGTYARVGQNDDLGSADGLAGFKLVCSHFDQYPFDPQQSLSDGVRCLPKARFVIISASAAPVNGNPTWNGYLQQVDAILKADYTCRSQHSIRVCERLSPTAPR